MRDAWRLVVVLVCSALVAGAAAAAAQAGTATGRPATFTAANGERNVLSVDRTASGDAQFADALTPIFPGLFCLPIPLGQATCDPDGDARDTDGGGLTVGLGDLDDRAVVRGLPGTSGRPGQIRVTGDAGADYLENASHGVIRFEGGAGDDTLVTGTAASAVLIGGSGADITASSGMCCATSYEDHERDVRVTLDGKPNDGAANEQDDVETSAVIGGPGSDYLIGDARANELTGAAGADILDGGGGNDAIDATLFPGTDGADDVSCGAGDDEVTAERNDTVAVDCELVRVNAASGPAIALDRRAVRATRGGSVTLTYRARAANAAGPLAAGTVRIVDSKGRSLSTRAELSIAAGQVLGRAKVALSRPTRRRLARSRTGSLKLFAQRTYSEAAATPGYARFNAPITVRGAQ